MKGLFKKVIVKILQNQVKRLVDRHNFKIIAITGSVGKTTTKSAIAHVLQSSSRILATSGNYNSEIGMPLSVFNKRVPNKLTDVSAWWKIIKANEAQIKGDYPYDYVIMEWGADHPGDIKNFASYITPDIGVLTAVAPAHTDGFGSVENILREKWYVVTASKKSYVNTDFQIVSDYLEHAHLGKVSTYGLQKADWQLVNISFNNDKLLYQADLVSKQNLPVNVLIPVVAKHSLLAPLVAASIAIDEGIEIQQVQQSLLKLPGVDGRMQILSGYNGSTIIDDTYNANSAAMIAGIETLKDLPAKRRIAVLGSINELGDLSESEHRLVGGSLGGVDILLTIGPDASNYLADETVSNGVISAKCVHNFDSPIATGNYLRSILKPDDLVLIKGSQNQVFAEEVTKIVLANPDDQQFLVRQSQNWLQIKANQFSDFKM